MHFLLLGYSALHCASCWGQIECLKVLVENSGNLHQKNCHGESPRDTAARYQQSECVDFLDWAGREMIIQGWIAPI